MSIILPSQLIEHYLLGAEGDRRQLQDSPLLGDVWLAYAEAPRSQHQLLVTPYRQQAASLVAVEIDNLIAGARGQPAYDEEDSPEVAFLQGFVAARVRFEEVLRVIVPLTTWWKKALDPQNVRLLSSESELREHMILALSSLTPGGGSVLKRSPYTERPWTPFDRFLVLGSIILWASEPRPALDLEGMEVVDIIIREKESIVSSAASIISDGLNVKERLSKKVTLPLIYQVSLNRNVSAALARSVPAVKADAARNLFSVDCSSISWAVIDSGVQGDHPAFIRNGESRVKASFDFTLYHRIVNLDNRRIFAPKQFDGIQLRRLNELLDNRNLKNPPSRTKAKQMLLQLAKDLVARRPLHWELVQPFVEIKVDAPPINDHGTHVAGIIGASKENDTDPAASDGMCPDIGIYDFRVMSANPSDTEFNVIAALQFIRHLNDRSDYIAIHGVNLSLSIPHNVRNYACGRTPVCVECERLVDTGVVVVAAAGNFGYQSYTTRDGSYDSYAAFSVTDPGNAEGVVTVGSTHRYAPHTYGVSFFSSRGPTGDGRPKPDVVAPGERIRAPYRTGWGDLDGTSMAAPHVSGAAAMLLARYTELIGRPRRIKQVLCESATDLGRERSFQGAGMLDVLRAFQRL